MWRLRSLSSTVCEIQDMLVNNNVDLLALCETWLDKSVPDGEVCSQGYSIHRVDRNRNGGGVAIIPSPQEYVMS